MSLRSKAHLSRVAALGCILCDHLGLGESTAEIHHVFDSAARSDWLTIPPCPNHHRLDGGFHQLGERAFNARYSTTEANLLAMTLEKVG